MFQQVSLGPLDAAPSPLTGEELDANGGPLRSRLLSPLDQLATLDAEDAEASRLAGLYVEDGVFPAAETLDARHAAHATAARTDIIVSLNQVNVPAPRRSGPRVLESAP